MKTATNMLDTINTLDYPVIALRSDELMELMRLMRPAEAGLMLTVPAEAATDPMARSLFSGSAMTTDGTIVQVAHAQPMGNFCGRWLVELRAVVGHPELPVAVLDAAHLLTVQQVADKLGLTPAAVYAMSSRGQLPGRVKVGARVRWRSDAIADVIANGLTPAVAASKAVINHVHGIIVAGQRPTAEETE